jgi:metal-responsive CopG/Arc/MetJ family transcriptional regulator
MIKAPSKGKSEPEADSRDPRIIVVMPESLVEACNQYRFDARLENRSAAIRALIEAGLEAKGKKVKK